MSKKNRPQVTPDGLKEKLAKDQLAARYRKDSQTEDESIEMLSNTRLLYSF